MIDFGLVKPGTTLYIPFASYSGTTGAPSAMTGLATSDILVYKDGGTTERASASGFTLLDTDGLDFDGKTGINGISIDLADNTTAGFWAAGSRYWVVVGDVTVDAQTVRFIAATFTIGLPGAVLNTTVATLSSQTSFTLTAGPAEDDALNGCVVYLHDVGSAAQGGFAFVSDYTGSTKTVTLAAGATFTVAATDHVMVLPPSNVHAIAGATAAATNLRASASVLYVGSVTGASPSTTTLVDSALTQSDADHWKGRVLIFTSGSLKYQATDITAFTAASDQLTFTALSSAPAQNDEYVIV